MGGADHDPHNIPGALEFLFINSLNKNLPITKRINSGASDGFHCFGPSGIDTVLSFQKSKQNIHAVQLLSIIFSSVKLTKRTFAAGSFPVLS